MADTVKLTLVAHSRGMKPGESLEVDPSDAKRLIDGGIAVPATKPAAKALGVDPESAASSKG